LLACSERKIGATEEQALAIGWRIAALCPGGSRYEIRRTPEPATRFTNRRCDQEPPLSDRMSWRKYHPYLRTPTIVSDSCGRRTGRLHHQRRHGGEGSHRARRANGVLAG